MGKIEESRELKKYIEELVRKTVQEETRPCLRLYKAVVTSEVIEDIGGSICEVKLVGEDTTLTVPSMTSGIMQGSVVWVGTAYNNFRNAFIFSTESFEKNV